MSEPFSLITAQLMPGISAGPLVKLGVGPPVHCAASGKESSGMVTTTGGYMVHFDQPAIVRSIIVQAHSRL